MYSAICAGLAAGNVSDTARVVLVFLAVHGALWAIYRALAVIAIEKHSDRDPEPAARELVGELVMEANMAIPDSLSKATAPGGTGTSDIPRHPLALELFVNCAICGSLLNIEFSNFNERPFGKQVLITVEKCHCKGELDEEGKR